MTNAALLTAIAKSIELSPLPVGRHEVKGQVTFQVDGVVIKGADVEYTPTVDIPMLATLALVLEKSGITREHSKKLLVEAMQEAIVLNQKGSETVAERLKDIETAMVEVREVTAALPKKTRSGATKVQAKVEVVE